MRSPLLGRHRNTLEVIQACGIRCDPLWEGGVCVWRGGVENKVPSFIFHLAV